MTAASELPAWALDLLLAVQQHENEHASDQPCLGSALDAVPADITRYAAVIEAHTRPLREQIAQLAEKLKVAELAANAGESYRQAADEAMDRVRNVSTQPQMMDSNEVDPDSYRRGFRSGVLAAQGALQDPKRPTISIHVPDLDRLRDVVRSVATKPEPRPMPEPLPSYAVIEAYYSGGIPGWAAHCTSTSGDCLGFDSDGHSTEESARNALHQHLDECHKPDQGPVPDDHPCGHCGHPKRVHITGPVWCRHCPAQTSGLDQPGWHQYTPAEEQP